MVLFLQTTHLDLVPATALHMDAQLTGPKELGKLLGVVVPKDWPPVGVDSDFVRGMRERLAKAGHDGIGWYGFYAIVRHTALRPSTLVGVGGFFGPPDVAGQVELGFGILPSFRGRGHATEMVEGLVAHALAQPGVQRIVADAQSRDRPTQAVLMRAGFTMVAPPESGLVRYLRDRDDVPPGADEDESADEDA